MRRIQVGPSRITTNGVKADRELQIALHEDKCIDEVQSWNTRQAVWLVRSLQIMRKIGRMRDR